MGAIGGIRKKIYNIRMGTEGWGMGFTRIVCVLFSGLL
jgi:hypothetical protein